MRLLPVLDLDFAVTAPRTLGVGRRTTGDAERCAHRIAVAEGGQLFAWKGSDMLSLFVRSARAQKRRARPPATARRVVGRAGEEGTARLGRLSRPSST